jgi:hypothetical protein
MADPTPYQQTVATFAEKLEETYSAYGGRGLVQGIPGDYLCYREGFEADRWVMSASDFEATHEAADVADEPPAEEAAPAEPELALAPASAPVTTGAASSTSFEKGAEPF